MITLVYLQELIDKKIKKLSDDEDRAKRGLVILRHLQNLAIINPSSYRIQVLLSIMDVMEEKKNDIPRRTSQIY